MSKFTQDRRRRFLVRGGVPAVVTVALLGATAAVATSSWSASGLPAPTTTAVPLPASITGVAFPSWTEDGSRIVAAARSTDFGGTQLVTFTETGADLRCLTCAAWPTGEPPLLKSFPFADGRRILVRIGEQTEAVSAGHGVVECTPSVTDCRSAVVVPIVAPGGTDPNVVQDQREYRVAPDGRHVGLTQLRRSVTGRLVLTGIVGELVRGPTAYEVADARVVETGGEVKGFTPDGRSVLFTRYFRGAEAANPDDYAVDLATGRERRVTYFSDWDEDLDLSPRQNWMVVGSARGTGTMETVAQVRRPSAIDAGIGTLSLRVFSNRLPERAEPWLVATAAERAREPGVLLTPGALADGWDARPNFLWKPDGSAIVYWQRRTTGTGSRVVVTRLGRAPEKVAPPATTPTSAWAAPVVGFVPPDPAAPTGRAGRRTGQMTVIESPSTVAGYDTLLEVSYRNFSDEAGFVINGVERALVSGVGTVRERSLYSAGLVVSGRHSGYLRATEVAIGPTGVVGTIESDLDGRRLTLTRP